MTRSKVVRAVLAIGIGMALVSCSPSADRRSVPPGTDRTIELSMQGMHFVPDRIEVRLGEQIAFVVTNPNDIAHEVYIGTVADQEAHRMMHQAVPSADQAQVPHGGYGIYLAPHETGVVSYHFDTAGTIMIGCHLPGHWEAGMKAVVTVKP